MRLIRIFLNAFKDDFISIADVTSAKLHMLHEPLASIYTHIYGLVKMTLTDNTSIYVNEKHGIFTRFCLYNLTFIHPRV